MDKHELQQIEEIAKVIIGTEQIATDHHCGTPSPTMYAKDLYWRGYRKQEWVSVEDKLPKEFVSVLGHMESEEPFPTVRECYMVGRVFFFPALKDTRKITHWMPMPEFPKNN